MLYSLSNPPPNIDEAKAYLRKCSVKKKNGCRIWNRSLLKRGGYGCAYWPRYSRDFNIKKNPTALRAHRMAWVVFNGPITEDQHVLHICDDPACIEEGHFFLGDQESNMVDKVKKDRQNKGVTHGMAKLTEKEVRAIRADTRLHRIIAEEFGVTFVTVSDIKRRRSWKHLK